MSSFGVVEVGLGRFLVAVDRGAVVRVGLPGTTIPAFKAELKERFLDVDWPRDDEDALVLRVAAQIKEYEAGQRTVFDVPVRLRGTRFQQEVWRQLIGIPFGQTRSYGELAARLGRPGAARAVGQANNRNPVPLFVPCHRVVAKDGLGGYGGGVDLKQSMLDIERR